MEKEKSTPKDAISVVMIVKNESHNIARCLENLSWAAEVLVLDTGSTDNTPQICRDYGASVHHLEHWEGFGKARQQAVKLATNNNVFSVDADELVSAELQEELRSLSHNGLNNYAYRVKVISYYLGKPVRYCGWQNESHLRLFDKRKGNFNAAPVHESIETTQPVMNLKGAIHHHTYPTHAVHLAKMRLYGELGAQKLLDKGKKTNFVAACLHAAFTFVKMYLLQLGFLDGARGFTLCKTTAWGTWYKYHCLWKLRTS